MFFALGRSRTGELPMSFVAGVKKYTVIGAAVALWIPAVGFRISTLWKYSITAGHPAEPPVDYHGSGAWAGECFGIFLIARLPSRPSGLGVTCERRPQPFLAFMYLKIP